MTRRVLLAGVALVLAASAGCSAEAAQERPSDGRLVLVSGRDDHGMLAHDQVEVYDGPESSSVLGRIDDGTLARVVDVEGQWLQVETVEGDRVSGWVDDFFLRGEVRLVGPAPGCEPLVGNRPQEPGLLVVVRAVRGGQVLVESVAGSGVRGWAPRDVVQELPPQGPDCGEDPPGGHEH